MEWHRYGIQFCMQFKQKKYSNAIFFVSNHIIFSFIWIKTANLHFGILCRFFSSLSRLKPYFYSVLSVYQNDLNLLIRMQYFVVIITYLPTEAIKMAFEELWLSNSSFEKTNTQQKKGDLNESNSQL